MRLVVLAASLFVSSLAFAYPNEKDKVEFVGTIVKADGIKSSVSSMIEVLEFLPERSEFLLRQEVSVDGSSWSKTEFVSRESMLTRKTVRSMLANCQMLGGQTTSVTVPAGEFNSCAIASDDEESSGTIWLADVPFGIVKADTVSKVDSSQTILELKSVNYGDLSR